ncbi:hypothetical protein SLEP1_g3762 [Rubroshorea leprosula]|uniref:Uncharacterized protein n=1 Tax=Rubroshorea leprosula TaxID=152421 RepID=A0AAV5HLK0_9ROSI|nr:hypothetical protein SLEP1_g3762 [Rubroshorea leprosula]
MAEKENRSTPIGAGISPFLGNFLELRDFKRDGEGDEQSLIPWVGFLYSDLDPFFLLKSLF